MKPNSPAKFIVKRENKRFYLCWKHMEREIQIEGTETETLPDDSTIGCQECFADRIDN